MTIRTQPMGYPAHRTTQRKARGLRHLLNAMKTSISKYVTVDNDGIFKDPNWPYMWNHKR